MKLATFEDGCPIGVARPHMPERALTLARKGPLPGEAASAFFARVGRLCGPYTFLGWLADDHRTIVDREGSALDRIAPGDSFVRPEGDSEK